MSRRGAPSAAPAVADTTRPAPVRLVEVARLAGLPGAVTTRAARLLGALSVQGDDTRLRRELATLDLGRLTPLQALETLHRWQRELGAGAEVLT